MGRARRSSASAPRASAPAPATRAAPAQQKTSGQQQQQPPQQTNVYVQRPGMGGGGMMGNMMSTMAGAAAGSVIGHGISNMMFSRDQAPAEPAQAQQLAQQASQEGHVCASQIQGYSKCMEFNQGHPEQCAWAWDMFVSCNEKSQQA